jgi:hypothetical protein
MSDDDGFFEDASKGHLASDADRARAKAMGRGAAQPVAVNPDAGQGLLKDPEGPGMAAYPAWTGRRRVPWYDQVAPVAPARPARPATTPTAPATGAGTVAPPPPNPATLMAKAAIAAARRPVPPAPATPEPANPAGPPTADDTPAEGGLAGLLSAATRRRRRPRPNG